LKSRAQALKKRLTPLLEVVPAKKCGFFAMDWMKSKHQPFPLFYHNIALDVKFSN
jgi:hypothetical protein